jgi:HK97 family phage prohead protease
MGATVHELIMELRDVDHESRTVVGVVAPYDELTYLVPDPGGERIKRGAFARSIGHQSGASVPRRIPLLRSHDQSRKVGTSLRFIEESAGLVGEFKIVDGPHGDDLLADCRNGCLDAMSVGFQPVKVERGDDGASEVREARLVEVSMVAVPAYAGAALMAVRSAQDLDALLAPFRVPRPDVNLSPIPPVWGR